MTWENGYHCGATAGKEGLALEYSLGNRICSSEVNFHLLAPLNELPQCDSYFKCSNYRKQIMIDR